MKVKKSIVIRRHCHVKCATVTHTGKEVGIIKCKHDPEASPFIALVRDGCPSCDQKRSLQSVSVIRKLEVCESGVFPFFM
jgi:hypothetical protein